jgi:hypothetical protein
MTVFKELTKYKLDLVGVQVRCDRGSTKSEGEYTFSMEREIRIINNNNHHHHRHHN